MGTHLENSLLLAREGKPAIGVDSNLYEGFCLPVIPVLF